MASTTTITALRQRRFFFPGLMLLFALAGMAAVVGSRADRADAAGLNQGQVVPETPRRDLPIVLDGEVRAHAQVGNRIFVGGDFQQVELIDGTVITQAHLFAYDINTGELDPNFRPILNKDVKSLEATDDGTGLYVGGRFTRWETAAGTAFPTRIAKLDAEGNLAPGFSATATAQVLSIEEVGSAVYIGGNFTAANGVPVTGLAKLDAATGVLDPNFNFVLGPSVAGSQLVKKVRATPDGNSLFVMHYGSTVNGQVREAVAKLELDNGGALSGWSIPWSAQQGRRLCWTALRDMAMSPDGSFIVIGGQGADNPPNCDSVIKYSTAGSSVTNFTWSARMYSSVFSMAVSDVAVYVGGHFCAAPKNPIPLGGVSSDFTGTANLCNTGDPLDANNPSQRDPNNAVFRNQMAALDPVTGQALPWDPGSDNFVAVYDLTLIPRGLLAGHDTSRFNGFGVGRSGLFDFGVPADTEAPTIVVTDPAPGTIIGAPTQLAGTAADDRGVVEVTIRLKNITTDEWLQPDGSFNATPAILPVTVTQTGLGEVEWTVPVNALPSGEYSVRGFSKDAVGNTSAPLASAFTIPGGAECSVVLDAEDQPVVSYSDFLENGVQNVNIRRNGGWQLNLPAGSGSWTDTDAAAGDYTYVVRWRPGGVITDVTCSPDPITVPDNGPDLVCTVGLDANSDPVLTWNALAGVNNYIIRELNNGYIDTVTNAGTSYTDVGRAPGDYEYDIRYRVAGVAMDVDCTPSPITVPDDGPGDTCTVAVNGAGQVEVNWSEVVGEDTYQVRDNDGWVATITNDTTYLDTAPTSGDRSYVVRYRMAGVNTDVVCNPDPITVP